MGFGTLLQRSESLLMALSELMFERVAAGSILVTLERGGQSGAKFFDKPLHCSGEPSAAPRRQLQVTRPLRIVEIVDVAPVGGRRFGLRFLAQQILDHQVPTGAARAERIN